LARSRQEGRFVIYTADYAGMRTIDDTIIEQLEAMPGC
jgi:hypothetical protein